MIMGLNVFKVKGKNTKPKSAKYSPFTLGISVHEHGFLIAVMRYFYLLMSVRHA